MIKSKKRLYKVLRYVLVIGAIISIGYGVRRCNKQYEYRNHQHRSKYINSYNIHEQCSREEAIQDYVKYNLDNFKISEKQFLGDAEVAIAGNPNDAYYKSVYERADKIFPSGGGVYIRKDTRSSKYPIPVNKRFKQVWGYRTYYYSDKRSNYRYIRYYFKVEDTQ